MLNKLLGINIAVYLLITVAGIFTFLFGMGGAAEYVVNNALALPASLLRLLYRIWTPITYMFIHYGFWHILGNMLWLYFMGQIFMMVFNGKQMFGVYILGGLSGALLYVLFYNLFPVFSSVVNTSTCIGASASVTAIVIAICVMRPNMEIRIFGIIPLTLKWLAILYVAYDLIQITGSNAGGHIAHIGGAIFGLLFSTMYRKGKDITNKFNSIIDKIVTLWPTKKYSKSNMHISYRNNSKTTHYTTDEEYNQNKAAQQARMDEILDKISQSGYDSLSKEEKNFLFKMSGK